MLKLDNPFLRAVALTVAMVFSFTAIAQAGDGQLLKSIVESDDETEETKGAVTETIHTDKDELREADSTLPEPDLGIAVPGLITAVPVSPLEVLRLAKIDEQWSSFTNDIIAGDSNVAMTYFLLVVAIVVVAWVLAEILWETEVED